MGYLVCYMCDIYYEVTEEEVKEFKNCGECGYPLTYFENLEDSYTVEEGNSQSSTKENHKTYTELKESHYKRMILFGVLIILIGLISIFLIPILGILLVIVGFFIMNTGYKKGYSWIKGGKGEKIMSQYLQQLPEDYCIFNDVKLSKNRGNIDHVVVGPTGIFVIETKNYSTPYIVQNDKWYYQTRYGPKLAGHNPGHQVISNAIMLRRLLVQNGVIDQMYYINSIVALNRNITLKGRLDSYIILKYENVTNYIINTRSNRLLEKNVVNEASQLIDNFATQRL